MATKFDYYQKILNHQRFQTGIGVAQTALQVKQTALMGHMAGTLNSLQGEMQEIRQLNLEGLAIQQEMLQREQVQSHLEEFIYTSQKVVAEFSQADSNQLPSVRFFTLKGIEDTVRQLGIGTPLIRGRENKAAFEESLKEVLRLTQLLENDPEVSEAIAWAKAEEKRIQDEKKAKEEEQRRAAAELAAEQRTIAAEREAEQRRISADKQARRNELSRRIEELKATRKTIGFLSWHEQKFGDFLNGKSAIWNFPILSSISKELRFPVGAILLWILPAYGFVWIPIYYVVSKTTTEMDLNSTANQEIGRLQRELAAV